MNNYETPRAAEPFLSSFLQTGYGKIVPDGNCNVTLTVQVEGSSQQVVFRLEELASFLQPKLNTHLMKIAKYRRVLRTKLPSTQPFDIALDYVQRSHHAALLAVMREMITNFEHAAVPVLDASKSGPSETLAIVLTKVALCTNAICPMLYSALSGEFGTNTEQGSIMRGTSFAAQSAKAFCAEGDVQQFRVDVLDAFVRGVCEQPEMLLEVNPSRAPEGHDVAKAVQQLNELLEQVIDLTTGSLDQMPRLLRFVCYALDNLGKETGLSREQRLGLVAGFIMLRFFNPGIITPKTYGLLGDFGPIAPNSAKNLLMITRVVQKMSTHQSFSEDFMAPVQQCMDSLYAKLSEFLEHCVIDPLGKYWEDCRTAVFTEVPTDTFDADTYGQFLAAVTPVLNVTRNIPNLSALGEITSDYRYLSKLQFLLVDEANYIGSLEGIQTGLRRVSTARGLDVEDDPFSDCYSSIDEIITWHVSIYRQIHERVHRTWHYVHKIGDILGRVLLEFEQVYEEFIQEYVNIYRMLVESLRALRQNVNLEPAVLKRCESVLTEISKPLKRLSGLLALFADGVLPESHPDSEPVKNFMQYGIALFNHLKKRVSVSNIRDIGAVELSFKETLCLLEPGRQIKRQGMLSAVVSEKIVSTDVWLFNDLFLAGESHPSKSGTQLWHTVVIVEVESVSVDSISGEPEAFLISSPETTHDQKFICQSLKQKNAWTNYILDAQKQLREQRRARRIAAANTLLPDIEPEDWQDVSDGVSSLTVSSGQTLDLASSIVLINHGQLQISVVEGASSSVVARFSDGEVVGQGALLGGYDRVRSDELTVVGSAPATLCRCVDTAALLPILDTNHKFAVKFYKTVTKANELLLKKLRLREAAARVISSKEDAAILASQRLRVVLENVDQGKDGKEALVESILRGSGRILKLDRSTWSRLIDVLEAEKLITKSGDGLTKKGKSAISDLVNVVKGASKTLQEALGLSNPFAIHFGMIDEESTAAFALAGPNSKVYLSHRYIAMVTKSLKMTKKKAIPICSVVAVEGKKKSLEFTFTSMDGKEKREKQKLGFKTQTEQESCTALLERFIEEFKNRSKNSQLEKQRKILSVLLDRSNPTEFPAGAVLGADTLSSDLPSMFLVTGNSSVVVVGNMASGNTPLYTLQSGDAFVAEPAFVGLPENPQVKFLAGPLGFRAYCINAETLREVDSPQIVAAALKWWALCQWEEILYYL